MQTQVASSTWYSKTCVAIAGVLLVGKTMTCKGLFSRNSIEKFLGMVDTVQYLETFQTLPSLSRGNATLDKYLS